MLYKKGPYFRIFHRKRPTMRIIKKFQVSLMSRNSKHKGQLKNAGHLHSAEIFYASCLGMDGWSRAT